MQWWRSRWDEPVAPFRSAIVQQDGRALSHRVMGDEACMASVDF